MKPTDNPRPLKNRLDQSRSGRLLFSIGLVATLLYVAGIVAYWFNDAGALLSLSPNEFGDFLAGTFAPLAFLWLVLGFLQQGDELRNSADALWLQGEELQNSVKQQRELVKVTREQLLFESEMLQQQREEITRNAQPILRLVQGGSSGAGEGTRLYRFQLLNHGKTCTGVAIHIERSPHATTNALPTGAKFEFNLELPIDEVDPFEVIVHYLDERLLSGSKSFTVSGANSRFDIMEDT